jgi:hypothetical protein
MKKVKEVSKVSKVSEVQEIEEQEIVRLWNRAEQIRDTVLTMVIQNVDDYKKALECLLSLSVIKLELDSKRQFFSKPLYDQMRRINAYFDQYLKPIEEADKILRQKIVQYRALKWEEFKQQEKEIYERIKDELGSTELPPVVVTPTLAKNEVVSGGEVTFRIVKKWVVEDESKLPREYLKPDEKKIAEAVKKGEEIPGVKVYTEEEPQVKII